MSFSELNSEALINNLLIPWGTRIVLALVVFIVGRWVARWLVGVVRKLMQRNRLDGMLIDFLCSILNALALAVVVLAALEQLGVNTTSALAILGAAGLAVGLALQGSLSNFASGAMLIIFRPFKAGDVVEVAGITGTVEQIQIFNTMLRTADNREIIVPNGSVYGGTIVNYSARDTRRVDLVFGIGYEDDIRKAKQIIERVMSEDARILADPAPAVTVAELADSSVNIATRPWVNSADYWGVRADLLENVKLAFDAEGISIPYPQQDVYMHEVKQAG